MSHGEHPEAKQPEEDFLVHNGWQISPEQAATFKAMMDRQTEEDLEQLRQFMIENQIPDIKVSGEL